MPRRSTRPECRVMRDTSTATSHKIPFSCSRWLRCARVEPSEGARTCVARKPAGEPDSRGSKTAPTPVPTRPQNGAAAKPTLSCSSPLYTSARSAIQSLFRGATRMSACNGLGIAAPARDDASIFMALSRLGQQTV
ncbi:Piso0_005545 [Millerozyma farinosa CBS 7064]|uniref:Piso0_005545 protein n=1 Tax=Pichia sorbitophila (strain ATCC MYA-4447 / BCRC 22081 / CBS 7064 / NBRC 10061 / NRRL Y-12695) TaxID=559304 RepID=G8Y295_PICSO|nr:Piso0_005545 [Millerozyma farinosa CBS 7064]